VKKLRSTRITLDELDLHALTEAMAYYDSVSDLRGGFGSEPDEAEIAEDQLFQAAYRKIQRAYDRVYARTD